MAPNNVEPPCIALASINQKVVIVQTNLSFTSCKNLTNRTGWCRWAGWWTRFSGYIHQRRTHNGKHGETLKWMAEWFRTVQTFGSMLWRCTTTLSCGEMTLMNLSQRDSTVICMVDVRIRWALCPLVSEGECVLVGTWASWSTKSPSRWFCLGSRSRFRPGYRHSTKHVFSLRPGYDLPLIVRAL